MVVGSKATQYAIAREVVVVAQRKINQPHLPPPSQQSVMNPVSMILFHIDLIQTPQVAGFVQLPHIEHQIPPLVAQPEILPGFQLLQANLGL